MKPWWPKIVEALRIWAMAVIFSALWFDHVNRTDVLALLGYSVLLQLAIHGALALQASWRARHDRSLDSHETVNP